MIGYCFTNKGIANSLGETRAALPYLDWLLQNHPEEEHKILYDLAGSLASLCHLIQLDKEAARKLLETEHLTLQGIAITYFPNKMLKIAGQRKPVAFSNAAQFQEAYYPDTDDSLEAATARAKQAVIIGKEAARTAQDLHLADDNLFGIASPFSREHIARLNPPTEDDLPAEVGELSYQAVKGNIMESYQIGHWQKAYDWDIRASYGWELSKLLDLRRGEWHRGQKCPTEAPFAVSRGILRVEGELSPFLWNSESSFTPVGDWSTVLVKPELDFIAAHPDVAQFEPEESWYWLPKQVKVAHSNGGEYHPYKGIINWLWAKRESAKSDIERKRIKRTLAALWGQTHELRNGEFGPWVCTPYAAHVEAASRCRVFDTILRYGVKPLSVSVDGFVSAEPVNILLGNKLGDWRLDAEAPCFVINSNVIAFKGHNRPGEFSVKYDWLQQQIENNPYAGEYQLTKLRVHLLGEAITGNYDNLGMIMEKSRSLRIGPDGKRIWPESPRSGKDLLSGQYHSEPMPLSILLLKKVADEANPIDNDNQLC